MKRRLRWIVLLGLLSGCSTQPKADLCDFFQPGNPGKNKVQPYGGVGIPQGPIVAVAPNISVGPPAAFPVVPPPVPVPGGGPPPIPPPMPPPVPGKF